MSNQSRRAARANRNVAAGPYRAFFLPLSLAVCLGGTAGCTLTEQWTATHDRIAKSWDESPLNPWRPPVAPPGPADSLVLRGDQLEPDKPPADAKGASELGGAHELYRRGDFAQAEKVFHHVAENTKNAPQVAEEARFYEAECQRRQLDYPKAADTYNRLVNDFHNGVHRDQSVERMFEIANYWLEDTREEIREDKEQKAGKRYFVWHGPVAHFEKEKPLFDEEGRAVEKLEQVALTDLTGPRADEALFLIGSVKFYREDYKEADRYFSQLVDYHARSKYAPQAMEYAIMSKHLSTGGPDYDGRKTAEARKYVDLALRDGTLPPEKKAFLERQLAGINRQQAEKDFKTAELYVRLGHPGSAYWCFEIVRRRYPGTPFAEQAAERMRQLKPQLEQAAAQGDATKTPGPAARPLPDNQPRYLPGAMPANPYPVVPTTGSGR